MTCLSPAVEQALAVGRVVTIIGRGRLTLDPGTSPLVEVARADAA